MFPTPEGGQGVSATLFFLDIGGVIFLGAPARQVFYYPKLPTWYKVHLVLIAITSVYNRLAVGAVLYPGWKWDIARPAPNLVKALTKTTTIKTSIPTGGNISRTRVPWIGVATSP